MSLSVAAHFLLVVPVVAQLLVTVLEEGDFLLGPEAVDAQFLVPAVAMHLFVPVFVEEEFLWALVVQCFVHVFEDEGFLWVPDPAEVVHFFVPVFEEEDFLWVSDLSAVVHPFVPVFEEEDLLWVPDLAFVKHLFVPVLVGEDFLWVFVPAAKVFWVPVFVMLVLL